MLDLLYQRGKCYKGHYWANSPNWHTTWPIIEKDYLNIKFPKGYNYTLFVQNNIPVLRKHKLKYLRVNGHDVGNLSLIGSEITQKSLHKANGVKH